MSEFKFPDVGEGITEGEIVSWNVKVGDTVKADAVLCEVETDKAVVEIPSPQAGKIEKLHYKPGDTVKVGATLVTFSGGEAPAKKAAPIKKGEVPKEKGQGVIGEIEVSDKVMKAHGAKKKETKAEAKVKATPRVRKLAKEAGVDLTTVKGSGPEGRITEADIKGRKKAAEPAKKVTVKSTRKYDFYGYIDHVPLKGIRKAVAAHMVEAEAQAVHVTHFDEVDVTVLHAIRQQEKAKAEKKGVKLTYLPFIIKACIVALKEHPYANASMGEDEIILKKYYNIGVAVDTEGGLMVPVLKGADQKSMIKMAQEIAEYAEKAKSRKINPSDMKGGTFTISNVGVIGGLFATPILNYPESAILLTGRIYEKPAVKENKVVIRKVLPISISFDHRIMDGAEAARFANGIKELLEDPHSLLIEE